MSHTAPASETWTLTAVAHRGGTVEELDIKAECEDGRSGVITMMRFPGTRWLPPEHLNLPPSMVRLARRVCAEAVPW